MVDSIASATTGLKDLTASAKEGDQIFTGFLGTMVEIAAKTDGAGKAWTTFSRLTSGSPVWKLQNKARAYLSILAGFQSRGLAAEKAQKAQNKAAVDSILAYDGMAKSYNRLNDMRRAGIDDVSLYTEKQKEAMQSTDAFAKTILNGGGETKAYSAAIGELDKRLFKHKTNIDAFTKSRRDSMDFKRGLQTPAGRERINEELNEKQNKMTVNAAKGGGGPLAKIAGLYILITKAGNKVMEFHRKRGLYDNKNARKVRNQDLFKLIKTGQFNKIPELFRDTNKTVSYIGLVMKILAIRNLATSKYGLIFRSKITKLMGGITPILNFAMKFFIYAILGIIIIMAAAKVLHDIADFMSHFGIMDDIKDFIVEIVDIIGKVFMVIGNLINGDFESLFGNLQSILDSLLNMAFIAGKIILKASIAILIGTFYSLIDMISYLFFEGNFMDKVVPALWYLLKVYLGLAFAKYILGITLHLIGIAALPIIMVVLIAAFMIAFWQKIRGNGIARAIFIAVALIVGIAAFLAGGWIIGLGIAIGLLMTQLGEKFSFFEKATGGTSHGGMTLVGEQGPELVNLPAGASVKTNTQTNKMMGGTTINNYITINAKDTSKAEMKRIANELSNMINMKMNRSGSSRTMR
tara:strand:+ start:220 stop:2121 length:1902 start_codon:yes stop_codon:yes gene_type:complete